MWGEERRLFPEARGAAEGFRGSKEGYGMQGKDREGTMDRGLGNY